MKFFCNQVLLLSLLIVAVFEMKYTDAWFGFGNANGDSKVK